MPTTSAVAAPRIIGSDARTSYSQLETIRPEKYDKADRGTDDSHRAPLLEHEPEHGARRRAKCQPDRHLALSLSCGIGR